MEDKMHRVFGIKEDAEYLDREGVYLIPYRNTQVGVVQTPKGYFFLKFEIFLVHRVCKSNFKKVISEQLKSPDQKSGLNYLLFITRIYLMLIVNYNNFLYRNCF